MSRRSSPSTQILAWRHPERLPVCCRLDHGSRLSMRHWTAVTAAGWLLSLQVYKKKSKKEMKKRKVKIQENKTRKDIKKRKSIEKKGNQRKGKKHIKGAVAYGNYFFPKKFEFVSLCSFICLQAVYQLSGPVCKATWNGCPSYSASYFHFTLCD